MKWAKNIKVLTRGTKVLIANLNNGKWVRTSNEAYALIKNMLSENFDIGDLIFEEPDDKKYIEEAIEALMECQLLVDSKTTETDIKKNISIELTNNCNLHCVHCCVEAGEKRKKDLSTEEIIDIFNKCISWNPKMITLSGAITKKRLQRIISVFTKQLQWTYRRINKWYFDYKQQC